VPGDTYCTSTTGPNYPDTCTHIPLPTYR
jgi:hypothetical protein